MDAEQAVNETETTATPTEQQATTQEAQEKLLSQDEVNRIVAERVAREKAKFEKTYGEVDLDLYKSMITEKEQARQAELEKRGEFEKLLKEQADKFQGRLTQYEQELQQIKVDGSLSSAAANAKAVNPNQVTALLKSQVRMNEAGGVDVLDDAGNVRYDDNGNPLSPQTLVNEFLSANPHFVQAGPTGTGTSNGVGKQTPVVDNDISKLDMSNPEHRKRFQEIQRAKGIRI
jgi:hypothetical protein